MERVEIDANLKKVFCELFQMTPDQINYESTPDTIEGWDSMAQIRIIASIEEEFDVVISPEQQGDMLTFELIGDITEELVN